MVQMWLISLMQSQTPLVQVILRPQTRLQLPQWLGSVFVLTQAPSQQVNPWAQVWPVLPHSQVKLRHWSPRAPHSLPLQQFPLKHDPLQQTRPTPH